MKPLETLIDKVAKKHFPGKTLQGGLEELFFCRNYDAMFTPITALFLDAIPWMSPSKNTFVFWGVSDTIRISIKPTTNISLTVRVKPPEYNKAEIWANDGISCCNLTDANDMIGAASFTLSYVSKMKKAKEKTFTHVKLRAYLGLMNPDNNARYGFLGGYRITLPPPINGWIGSVGITPQDPAGPWDWVPVSSTTSHEDILQESDEVVLPGFPNSVADFMKVTNL